jgi:hypothetical protein
MLLNNRIDKTFGPAGSFAGTLIFICGIVISIFSLPALILLPIGAFVGFSSTCTLIDINKKRIKFSNNLFGIIKTGEWIDIESDMTLQIKRSDQTWMAYSRSNQKLDISDQDYRIILFDSSNRKIMPVMKTKSYDAAKEELEKLNVQLGLTAIPSQL